MSTLDIPGYSIKRILGRGGMATVYLAEQEKFERDVALKVMAPALSADEGFRERFLREAKIVAKISHPHIVAVYDVNEVNGAYYIAMEYHPGGDLKARLKEGITVREALQITRDVARALDFAHGKGYLHRDIKPDNILFRADGSAVLTDFGIAKATEGDANLTQMGMVAGTPKYMSPEQARGQTLDADSDLYSLGVVFFEMLTGRLPYEATDAIALGILHMNAPVPKLEGRLAHFQPLLDRLLAKQPGQRPQSGAKLVLELDALEKTYDFNAPREATADDNTVVRPAAKRAPVAAVAAAAPVSAPAPAVAAAPDIDATVLTPSAAASPAVASATPVSAPVKPASGKIAAAVGLVVVLAAGGGYWAKQDADARTRTAQVASALQSGDAALSRNALTAPADDNALAHYRRVLELEPGHAAANAGLQKILAALQAQAYAALAAGNPDAAASLLAQASSIAPAYPGHPDLERAIAGARTAEQQAPAVVESTVVTPAVRPAASRPVVQAVAQERIATNAASEPDALARLRISGMLGSAQRALEDGDSATAVQRFEQVLKIDPANREAREGLRQARAR
ncbi:MAG: serine/threonine protein kinase [Moraxellaceae bacterium]|jgi:predicted Ser/Thr protein kinase|nr:serine/threonine protein kinase [Moraxellaceae bacterium]